jgi:hypothetical protein
MILARNRLAGMWLVPRAFEVSLLPDGLLNN